MTPSAFKVMLVYPACMDARVTDEDARVLPMGLLYLGALLKDRGVEVQVTNLAVEKAPDACLEGQLTAFSPDVVGFSVLNAGRHNAVSGAALVRRLLPEGLIVFGGPTATFLPGHLMATCPELDVIIKGEGENSFSTLVDHLTAGGSRRELQDIPGLVYRGTGGIMDTGDPEHVTDLDRLPHPGRYYDHAHISLSRGCPGRCRFCGSPAFWKGAGVRFHSPEWFVDEMTMLFQKGVRHFYVSDDTFTLDKKRVISVCRGIRSRGLSCTWVAISRVDAVDDEILYHMRLAGCTQISYGVESGDVRIRKTLGKPCTDRQIIDTFDRTRRWGILPRAYLIYGAPGETDATIQAGIDLMHRIRPLSLVAYMLVVFPGTRFYADLERRGILGDDIWSHPIEDIPWFQLDPGLDMETVIRYGQKIRNTFHAHVSRYALELELVDREEMYPFHADFLSRLAMTFSHGDYGSHPRIHDAGDTARRLYERALSYAPDARAFLGLGMLLQKQRAFEKAAGIMETALGHFPNNLQLITCLGVSLMNLGRFDEALDLLSPFSHEPSISPYIQACRAGGALG